MLENFSQMIKQSWERGNTQYGSEQNITAVNNYSCRVLSIENTNDICNIYKNYKGCKEFLYIPSKEEINKNITDSNSCYVGLFNNKNNLIGINKLERLTFPYPFFTLPKSEKTETGDCYGLSGLIIASEYRNKGLAKKLVNTSLKALSLYGAKGVYADCEYRNQASFAALSQTFNFIGYTDGRNGAEGEKTIYLTFYKNCKEKYTEEKTGISLNFTKAKTLDDVTEVLNTQLKEIGTYSCLTTPYQEGYNKLNILDKPILTPKIKLILKSKQQNKIITMVTSQLLKETGR